MWEQVSAEPTMANNTEDIENNMVSIPECVTAELPLSSAPVALLTNDYKISVQLTVSMLI